jgi:hypothetical protein
LIEHLEPLSLHLAISTQGGSILEKPEKPKAKIIRFPRHRIVRTILRGNRVHNPGKRYPHGTLIGGIMRFKVSLRRALEDSSLLGAVLGGDSWRNWRTILIAANGEELTEDELAIYRKFTGGRPEAPKKRVNELCAQSEDAAASQERRRQRLSITTLSANITWEKARVLLIAQDRAAAKVSLDYVEGCLDSSPMLRQLIKERKREELALTNGVVIEVRAPTLRGVRGVTCVAVIADDIAFWRSEESANPAVARYGRLTAATMVRRAIRSFS